MVGTSMGGIDPLEQRLTGERSNLLRVVTVMKQECERLGFAEAAAALDDPLVNPELRKDSFDGSESLFAEWRTPTGALLGYVLIHGGGQIYAEFDIVKPHPTKPQWVVEAMTVWGDDDTLKADPRLLPALGD